MVISIGKFFSTIGHGTLPKGSLQLHADKTGRMYLRLLMGKKVVGDVYAAAKGESPLIAVQQGVKNLEQEGFTLKPIVQKITFPDGPKTIRISSEGCKLMDKTITPEDLRKALKNAYNNAKEYMSFNYNPATAFWGQTAMHINAVLNRLSLMGK